MPAFPGVIHSSRDFHSIRASQRDMQAPEKMIGHERTRMNTNPFLIFKIHLRFISHL